MKYGILSIILAFVGICLVVWFNYELVDTFTKEFIEKKDQTELNPSLFTIGIYDKIKVVGLGLIGLFFGIKSFRSQSRIGILGIILSFILLIMTFIPLWTYFVMDTTLDINFSK